MGGREKCEVMKEVKRQTLKWFGHVERMAESKVARRVCVREAEARNDRGRLPGKWRDRDKGERSFRNFDQARKEGLDREMEALLLWPSHSGSSYDQASKMNE